MTTSARLRAFVAVCDAGSVRAAAQRLFVTESAISSAVAALAREVGVALLEPRGRGVQITPAGTVLAEYARTILGLHEEAFAAARGDVDSATGTLRVAAVPTAAEHVLPTLLAQLRAEFPELTVTLDVDTREHVWQLLVRHEVDVVIAGRPPGGSPMCVRAVRPNDLVVVAAPELAAMFDVMTTTWLLRESGSGTREACESMLINLEAPAPRLMLGSNGAVIAGARAGLGATLVSRDAVRVDLHSGALAEIQVAGTPLSRPWHAVTHPRTTPQATLFVRHLLHSGTWSHVPARA